MPEWSVSSKKWFFQKAHHSFLLLGTLDNNLVRDLGAILKSKITNWKHTQKMALNKCEELIYKWLVRFQLGMCEWSNSNLFLDVHTSTSTNELKTPWVLIWGVKLALSALAGVAQWIEYWTANQRVTGLIPSQGTCLGCGPGLQLRACKRQPHINVALPFFLPPFPFL